jgi:hypothetical protein
VVVHEQIVMHDILMCDTYHPGLLFTAACVPDLDAEAVGLAAAQQIAVGAGDYFQ